eukprot:6888915-Karenia_brevis.AAC.1
MTLALGFTDPAWWIESVPESLCTHSAIQAWKSEPTSLKKASLAIAAFLREGVDATSNLEEADDIANATAALRQ